MPCSGVAPSQLPHTKRVLHGYDLKHYQLPKLLVFQDSWQDHLWPANRLLTHHNQCTSRVTVATSTLAQDALDFPFFLALYHYWCWHSNTVSTSYGVGLQQRHMEDSMYLPSLGNL